jgi:hypothetical protein
MERLLQRIRLWFPLEKCRIGEFFIFQMPHVDDLEKTQVSLRKAFQAFLVKPHDLDFGPITVLPLYEAIVIVQNANKFKRALDVALRAEFVVALLVRWQDARVVKALRLGMLSLD